MMTENFDEIFVDYDDHESRAMTMRKGRKPGQTSRSTVRLAESTDKNYNQEILNLLNQVIHE